MDLYTLIPCFNTIQTRHTNINCHPREGNVGIQILGCHPSFKISYFSFIKLSYLTYKRFIKKKKKESCPLRVACQLAQIKYIDRNCPLVPTSIDLCLDT